MELFDKRFVHFMWDDSLEDKEGFVACNIDSLINYVEHNQRALKGIVKYSGDSAEPFMTGDGIANRFFYYDPNYECKKAFAEGKAVQYKTSKGEWETILSNMELMSHIEEGRQLRIKPEEEKWIVYLCRRDSVKPYLTACCESRWEVVQKDYGAKTKLFVGAENECTEWYEARRKFAEVIEVWEDGKTIQYKTSEGEWHDCPDDTPFWDANTEYRVKPEEPKHPCKECAHNDGMCDPYDCENNFEHKNKRMTYRQLAEYVKDNSKEFRECLSGNGMIQSNVDYSLEDENKECDESIKVRSNFGEWRDPTVDLFDKER